MRHYARIWVVVADSARVRAFSANEGRTRLIEHELEGVPAVTATPFSRELASDRPGRTIGSMGGGVRHAIEPRHDYHKQEKHKFVAGLAEALDRAFAAGQYDRLVLVAPPRTLGELRRLLSIAVQASAKAIAKDLTKAPLETIWSEVAETLQEWPVASAS